MKQGRCQWFIIWDLQWDRMRGRIFINLETKRQKLTCYVALATLEFTT